MRPSAYVVHVEAGPSGGLVWQEAVRRARQAHATLHAIRVIPKPLGVNPLLPQAHRLQVERSLAIHLGARRQLYGLAKAAGGVHVEISVVEGDPAVELVRATKRHDAELLFIGDGALAAAPLGCVANRVVQHAECGVLVVRKAPERGVVIGGTDLSDATLPVVSTTCSEAERSRSRAIIAYSLEAVYAVSWLTQEARARASRVAREATSDARVRLQRALRKYPLAEPMVIDGGVGPALVATAAKVHADLLVVGTTRQSSSLRCAFGEGLFFDPLAAAHARVLLRLGTRVRLCGAT